MTGERLTIRGQVQGVGFRPTVWRLAQEMGLTGDVRNTNDGVEIRLWGDKDNSFVDRLRAELPVLAKIETLERAPLKEPSPEEFGIVESAAGKMRVNITPDAATCEDCLDEMRDPLSHRYWYAFTNCTNCGPRFSIIQGAPYDRAKTTMRDFTMCTTCAGEYGAPHDRRFHAQPIACAICGPKAWFEKLGQGAVHAEAFSMMDDVDAAGGAIMNGHIVAVKGLGGFHLACDATKADAVERLRQTKRRRSKAFALMARDLDVIRQYADVNEEEEALLTSPAAPIVLLKAKRQSLPNAVAPGLDLLGFMLPNTPMHHLMLRRMKRPVVMTSGNISGEPQCTKNDDAREKLAAVADFALLHNRPIANRIDDSVVRVISGKPQSLRRARGYAPQPINLPKGFCRKTQLLALGSELKNTFCVVKDGQAILSQHMGDLENAATHADVEHNLSLYKDLFEHQPTAFAVDSHPEYLSTKRGYEIAGNQPVIEVQHHHAHIASAMAENGLPLHTKPVLGIAMDGLGLGDDGTIWGGEFLACTYQGYKRLGHLKPVALLGGSAAVRQPWRNLYAHLVAEMGWGEFQMNFRDLTIFEQLNKAPRETLDAMIKTGTNAPLSSSCGRLFDAAAALVGLAWDTQSYEGEAAMLFEAALDRDALNEPEDLAYPFSIPLMNGKGLPYIEPLAVWRAMLGDLILKTPIGVMSARFHRGLANAIVAMAKRFTADSDITQVALSGGCFQDATLFTLVEEGLTRSGLEVIRHSNVPANDGGLSLGQAVVALATLQREEEDHVSRDTWPNR